MVVKWVLLLSALASASYGDLHPDSVEDASFRIEIPRIVKAHGFFEEQPVPVFMLKVDLTGGHFPIRWEGSTMVEPLIIGDVFACDGNANVADGATSLLSRKIPLSHLSGATFPRFSLRNFSIENRGDEGRSDLTKKGPLCFRLTLVRATGDRLVGPLSKIETMSN